MPIKSLDHLVATSPLLFWTILLIACQSYDAHHALYSQLLSPYQELLKPLSTRAIHSIDEIHALLLLCIWPLPTKRPLLDPTWTYINIAIGACTKMNFHKPLPQGHIAQGFASWPDTSAAITVNSPKLTWLACFIISTQYETPRFRIQKPASTHMNFKGSGTSRCATTPLVLQPTQIHSKGIRPSRAP